MTWTEIIRITNSDEIKTTRYCKIKSEQEPKSKQTNKYLCLPVLNEGHQQVWYYRTAIVQY